MKPKNPTAQPRTFDEARKLVNEVKKARGYFPIVGIGSYDDGFNSLPGNRSQSAPRGRGAAAKGRGKGGKSRKASSGSKAAGKGTLGVTPPQRDARMPQQPAAKFRKGGTGQAQRGGPHHAATDKTCFICGKLGHLSRDCPNRSNKRTWCSSQTGTCSESHDEPRHWRLSAEMLPERAVIVTYPWSLRPRRSTAEGDGELLSGLLL